jgi:hypothetical protein
MMKTPNKLECLYPAKPFHTNQIFEGKVREPARVEHLSGAPLHGRLDYLQLIGKSEKDE